MEIDKTTYNDLAIFQSEEEFSIFHRIDFTRTVQGREWLLKFCSKPMSEIKPIQEIQQILRTIHGHIDQWPISISNGTVMVMERFYESNIDSIPSGAN